MGFLILIGQQVVDHLNKKNRALLENAREMIIGEIRKKVSKTLTLVEQLSGKLEGQSPERIGVELIQSREANEVLEHAKGPPFEWFHYVDWLNRSRSEGKKVTCLTVTISANRHYDVGLLLAYLLANPDTKAYIGDNVIRAERWHSFPDSEFISRFKTIKPDLNYVLFYHGDSGNLIGFADARLFAEELMLYARNGQQEFIARILNRSYAGSIEDMEKYFHSFQAHVAEGKDAYVVAKEMLNKKINEMAVMYNGKHYLVSLANIVRIVS
jgi:hypothetical protein